MHQTKTGSLPDQWGMWLQALRNLPAVFAVVWESGRAIVAGAISLRILSATLPLAMLAISRSIIDGVTAHGRGQPLSAPFWH